VLEHDPVGGLISVPDRILGLVAAQWMEPHDFIALLPDVRSAVFSVGNRLSYVEAIVTQGVEAMVTYDGCLPRVRGCPFRSVGCVGTERPLATSEEAQDQGCAEQEGKGSNCYSRALLRKAS
jgi:hypothetical protein